MRVGLQIGPIGSLKAARMARWLAVAIVLAYVVSSWFPFELDAPRTYPNDAQRDDTSWRFGGEGLALTDGAPSWVSEVVAAEAFRLDVEFRTSDLTQDGPARLLALSARPEAQADIRAHNLMVGQEERRLEVRLSRLGSDIDGVRVNTTGLLEAGTWHRLQLEVDRELALNLDGRLDTTADLPDDWADQWFHDALLSLGDTPSASRSWDGEIRRAELTVADETFDLLSDPDLVAPETVRYRPGRLDGLFERDADRPLYVWLLHLAIGFGLAGLAVIGWRHHAAWRIVSALAALVVIINLGKIGIATRHPSVLTTAVQLLGMALGTLIATRMFDRTGPESVGE